MISKRGKRGQMTLFIIIAVVIVAVVVLFFVFRPTYEVQNTKNKPSTRNIEQSTQEIKDYVQGCALTTAKNTLSVNLLQGGYYNPSSFGENYIEYHLENFPVSVLVPLYIHDNKSSIPSINLLEEQLKEGIKDGLKTCLNFSNFSYPVDYSYDNITVNCSLDPQGMHAEISVPIGFRLNESTIRLDNTYPVSVETNFLTYYDYAKSISENQIKTPDSVCLSCMDAAAKNSDITVKSVELQENNSLIIIYSLTNGTEMYSFAHELNITPEKAALVLEEIPDIATKVGAAFNYSVQASGENITYSDDTDLFDIDSKTGLILFTPTESDIGPHVITVTATSGTEKRGSTFILEVTQ